MQMGYRLIGPNGVRERRFDMIGLQKMDSRPKAAWVKKREMFTQLVSELCARVAVYGWNIRLDVLSVFITPWMKPSNIHGAISCACRAMTPSSSARYGCAASG